MIDFRKKSLGVYEFKLDCAKKKVRHVENPLIDNNEEEDEDVLAEEDKVRDLISRRNLEDYPVVFHDIVKTFSTEKGKKTAVNKVSLSLKKGKVFGLLGVNGAGFNKIQVQFFQERVYTKFLFFRKDDSHQYFDRC